MIRPDRTADGRRLAMCLVLLGVLVASLPTGPLTARIVHAAAPQQVWKLAARTFDPANGQDQIAATFTPSASAYLVEVALQSSDGGDEAYVQLGTDNNDATQVTAGEDRFFAISHLAPGTMPPFRMIPDPKHDYGGRTLTYAVAVYAIPALPLNFFGTAVSTIPNIVAATAPSAGSYTVHYSLSNGSAHIIVLGGDNKQHDSGKVSGEGAFSVTLPAGVFAIALKQIPDAGTSVDWHLTVGRAPTVTGLNPANNASLKRSPAALSAGVDRNAQLILDHHLVGSSYDAATGKVTYRPPTPLAAGVHLLQVTGLDGVPAVASSQFVILPDANIAPPTSPAGSISGQPWVNTSTPDGRYRLQRPASWRLVAAGTRTLLIDPKGSGMVILDERFLGQTLDGMAVAKTISAKLAGSLTVQKAWQFNSAAGKTFFSGVVAVKGHAGVVGSVNMVYPAAADYALLLGFGFCAATDAAVTTVARIETSLAVNRGSAIAGSRRYQRYDGGGLSLDYPQGWAANFAATNVTWFVGPQDGAVLIAVGASYHGSGANAAVAQTFAGRVQDLERTAHPKLTLIGQSSAAGIQRWLGVYPTDDGTSVVIEIGQVVVGNGHIEGMWGDTPLERATSNLAVLQRAMDSAASNAHLTPPTALTADALLQAIRNQYASAAAATTSNGSSSSASSSNASYWKAYQKLQNQQLYFQTMENVMTEQYATTSNIIANMGDSPYRYEVTYTDSSY